ncbi:MAG: hypothetical protein AAB242_09025, partial [Nitrospirota bacterium]
HSDRARSASKKGTWPLPPPSLPPSLLVSLSSSQYPDNLLRGWHSPGMPSRVAHLTGGPRYPPRRNREGKLELTRAHGHQTVAAGIPEGFRPVQPGRIGPGGRCANRDGIPLRQVSATIRSPSPIGYIVPHVLSPQSPYPQTSPPTNEARASQAGQSLLAVSARTVE